MQELTYILGAGASYQSFPIVKTFSERFRLFMIYFQKLGDVYKTNSEIKSKFDTILYKIFYLNEEFKSHQSFDTYFKKLFHTKQPNEINCAKKILHLYFIWEHLEEVFYELKQGNSFNKQAKIDKRYDALIAGLLKPIANEAKSYCKTNFITWNYDLNLLKLQTLALILVR